MNGKLKEKIAGLRIVSIYAFCSILWISFSDQLVLAFFHDPLQVSFVGAIKGYLFISVTSLLLLMVLNRKSHRLLNAMNLAEDSAYLSAHRSRREIVIFIGLSLFLVVAGGIVFQILSQSIYDRENKQLATLAKFKKEQIEGWLFERRSDLRVYIDNMLFIDILNRFATEKNQDLRERLLSRLEASRQAHGYARTEIRDGNGQILVSTGEDEHFFGEDIHAALRRAADYSEPVLVDLHRQEADGMVRMAFVAALRDRPEHPVVGFIVFTVDPDKLLYPMLGAWPIASDSGEIILVRREGDLALFLSPLRHRPEEPLTLRLPLSRRSLPAAQAVLQGDGLYSGQDYRGTSVLTAVGSIVGTPWMLLIKVDEAEVFSGVRRLAVLCAGLIFVGIVVSGLFLAATRREQRLRDRIRLNLYLETLVANVPGSLFSLLRCSDGTYGMPFASKSFHDLVGLSPNDLRIDIAPLRAIVVAEDVAAFDASLAESADAAQPWRLEWRIRRPVNGADGECWIEGRATPQRTADGGVLWHGYLHDVTDRKRSEMELNAAKDRIAADMDAMNRLHVVGRLYVHHDDLTPVLNEIIEVAIAIAHADMGVIQLSDPYAGRMIIVAHRGFEPSFLDFWNGVGESLGRTALKRRDWIIIEDVAVDPIFTEEETRNLVLTAGVQAIQSAPLISRCGQILGMISTYYRTPGRPDQRCLTLLDLVIRQTTDIVEKFQAVSQIREKEDKLQLAQNAAGFGWWEWNIDTGEQHWSPKNYALHGLEPGGDRHNYDDWYNAVHPEDRDRAAAAAHKAVAEKSIYEADYRIILPDGNIRWLIGRGKVLTDRILGVRRMLGVNLDISQRKQTEIAQLKANRANRARSLSNLELLRADDEASYLHAVCQIIIEVCGHAMMWIGYAEDDVEKSVRPVAFGGIDQGYLEEARVSWAENDRGRGPTGTAIRTRQPSLCRDITTDPNLRPWRAQALERGYASSVALPLMVQGQILGALTIYASEPDVFPDEEVKLLSEIADDLAYGVSVLRLRGAHRRAEHALRESEERLRFFIEYAPASLAMLDADMRYLYVSRRWLKDYRLTWTDISGKSHYEVFPEIPERWKAIHRRCLAGAVEKCDEDPFPRPDGRTDWLHWEIRPWRKTDGEIGGVVIFSEHITAQVEARNELRKLSLAVEQNPNSIIITALDGAIEYVNEAFTRTTGYSREEALGRNPEFLSSVETSSAVIEEVWTTVRQGGVWRGEFYNQRKSGKVYTERAWISPVRGQDGSIINYLGILEDVTEKKRIDEELMRHRLHLEDLVAERTSQLQESSRIIEERAAEIADLYNRAPCGYHSLDEAGLFTRINDTELSWLGYRREEVVGVMYFRDLLDEEGVRRHNKSMPIFQKQGVIFDLEYRLRTKNGRWIPVLLSATAVCDASGAFVMSRSVVYNLTDIKAVEKAAEKHAQLAEAFFQQSVVCLVVLDRCYNFLRVNEAYARVCRRKIEDFKGRNHFEMYPSDTKRIFDEVVQNKRPFETFSRAFTFPDQPERGVTYWDWTLVPILDHVGEIEYLVFSLTEVTERVRVEEALRENEAKYRALFDHSPDSILLIDPQTMRPIEFNRSAYRSLGYERDAFAALRLSDINIEKTEQDIRRHLDKILLCGRDDFECLHRTCDGEVRNRLVSVQTTAIHGQTVLHAIWRDITDIRRAQKEIEENERRLVEITAALGEGLHVINDQGRIVFSNPAASRLLGWSETEMLGAEGHQLVHPHHGDEACSQEKCALYCAYSSGGSLLAHEDAFWTKDGRSLLVSATLTPLWRDGRSVGAVIAFQDISERKRNEMELSRYRENLEARVAERTAALNQSNRELAAAKQRADDANLAKSSFLAGMSHELRTPLAAILGFSQLLMMKRGETLTGNTDIYIDHIIRNGRHLLALINDLLDLAKIDVGKIAICIERTPLTELLAYLEASLMPLAEIADVTVVISPVDPQIPGEVLADPTRLHQALLNLATNAVKYNRPGGMVNISCEQNKPGWIRLKVIDTGFGIPEERQTELFQPFNRLGQENSTIDGAGIGLALTRKLVHLMGGTIDFCSTFGEGSQFWIDIPTAPLEDAEEFDLASMPDSTADDLTAKVNRIVADRNRTVLYVDDNQTALDLVEKILAEMPNVTVLTARTAEAGIESARRHRPDIILMDINLPQMNGVMALMALRRYDETRNIPVFALSAAAGASDIEHGLAAGFERYLTKPYDVSDLLSAVIETFLKLSVEENRRKGDESHDVFAPGEGEPL
ncbi:membrane hypothetical protein [Azospirillaceae bacterium]